MLNSPKPMMKYELCQNEIEDESRQSEDWMGLGLDDCLRKLID